MKYYIFGILTIPALYIFFAILGIWLRASRDTLKYLKMPLQKGYGKWHWIYIIPCIFCGMIKQQCWSYWNGISTEVDPVYYGDEDEDENEGDEPVNLPMPIRYGDDD